MQRYVKIGDILYTSMFPQYVKAGDKVTYTRDDGTTFVSEGATFAFFLDQFKRDRFADLLADALGSDHFFAKAMARREADPANFPQYVNLQLYKLEKLIGENHRHQNVFDKWAPFIRGRPWRRYQYITFDKFSEQTFMPEVQAAITAPTQVGQHSGASFCAGGPNARCHVEQIKDYNHGLAVEAWLKSPHIAAPIFTGTAPDNKQ
jgi:hypothetical protein